MYGQVHACQIFIKWSTRRFKPKDPADIKTCSWSSDYQNVVRVPLGGNTRKIYERYPEKL